MTEEKKTEAAAGVDVAEFNAMKARILKYEEDLAYSKRENEKLAAAKAELDKITTSKAESGDPDAIKKIRDEGQQKMADVEEKYKKELASVSARLREETIVKSGLVKAMSVFNDSEDIRELLTLKLQKYCDTEDGKIVIKNDKGEVRYSETNKRDLMSLDEYIAELASRNPALVRATTPAGTRGTGERRSTGGASLTLQSYSKMTSAEQKALKLTPEEARALLRQSTGAN